jgi:phosphatidylserine decarboxylase
MHLLFYGKEEIKVLGNKRVDEILREQSIKVSGATAVYCEPILTRLLTARSHFR